jgi:hypothetical protein
MKTLFQLMIALAVVCAAAPARSQEGHLELAEAVVAEFGGTEAVLTGIESSAPMILEAFRTNIPDLTAEEGEQIMAYFMDEMRILMPRFVDDYAALIARHLTASELREMLDDPETTLDGRLTEVSPLINRDANALGEAYGAEAMSNALPRIQELLANR